MCRFWRVGGGIFIQKLIELLLPVNFHKFHDVLRLMVWSFIFDIQCVKCVRVTNRKTSTGTLFNFYKRCLVGVFGKMREWRRKTPNVRVHYKFVATNLLVVVYRSEIFSFNVFFELWRRVRGIVNYCLFIYTYCCRCGRVAINLNFSKYFKWVCNGLINIWG